MDSRDALSIYLSKDYMDLSLITTTSTTTTTNNNEPVSENTNTAHTRAYLSVSDKVYDGAQGISKKKVEMRFKRWRS